GFAGLGAPPEQRHAEHGQHEEHGEYGEHEGEEAAAESVPAGEVTEDELTPEERRKVASWDRDLPVLAEELRQARSGVREVRLPLSLTATQVQRLAADPDGFARELARPMPRPPQPAARRGTRFHAWVQSSFETLPLPLLGPDELPGGDPGEDAEIRDEEELAALKEAFSRTPYARRRPYRIEAPFQLQLAGRVIRGRIDAVYRVPERPGRPTPRFEVIDWKTARRQEADPLQLAIYRLAWAERHQLPLSEVSAAFLYVRSGELVRPSVLPGRRGLERLLTGEDAWELNDPG
ncbi:PD-(D/E)XK nuclease family protein, partial [Streptomyces sedi]|uniref:PD-(D/E)XK nuclease family protein n=1 Tax=Streptomyces sedi TaxID=555059 RepID=UPI0031F13DED